jgi:hypothetical protein
MGLFPSSPRQRRRLTWFCVGVAIGGALAAVVLLVPDPKQPNPAPPKNARPAQLIQRSTKVTRSERRAIDVTLDRFLRAGLDRSAPATAWRLAGPEMRAGSSLRQWHSGTTPIPYYPPRDKTFHSWAAVDAGPRYVVFDHLVVHPRHGPQTSSWIFAGEVVKPGSHWLVNRLYTIAVMQRPTKTGTHQVGPMDYAAPPVPTAPARHTSGGTLGKTWLFAVGGLICLALLFPLGFVIASGIRSRRFRKRYAAARRELPPLPSSVERRPDPVGTGSGSHSRP